MFLPQNMTESEKGIAAAVVRQVLAADPKAGPARIRQLKHQAEKIAAEQIHTARAEELGEGQPEAVSDDQPNSLFRRLSGTELALDIAAEWEKMVSDRVYREAIESGEIQPGDEHELSKRIYMGIEDIGDPPESLVELMIELHAN